MTEYKRQRYQSVHDRVECLCMPLPTYRVVTLPSGTEFVVNTEDLVVGAL